jgi:hypothetical protein
VNDVSELFFLLLLLLIGALFLIFKDFFVDVSSIFDWIFGTRFQKSMKKFKEVVFIIVGIGFVVASICGLYQFIQQKL